MDKKCSKYEGLFIFSDEDSLLKHIENCPECYAEHIKMQKVSDLIGETKFYYRNKARKARKVKAACIALFMIFFSATFGFINDDGDLADSLMYGYTLSAEELGLPVDSYGLLMVD